jgi:hypothetical protein
MAINGAKGIIDSIVIKNYCGINRKTLFTNYTSVLYPTKWIEGIGSNRNFPLLGFGEWGIPAYTLKCFSKNGVKLYGDSMQVCIKKKLYPLIMKDLSTLKIEIYCKNNKIEINNLENKELKMELFDMMGKKVLQRNLLPFFNRIECINTNGIYLIKIIDKSIIYNQKIMLSN